MALLKRLEDFCPQAYFDVGGKPTIGYGNTSDVTAADVLSKRTITEAHGVALLERDIGRAEDALKNRLSPSIFAALTTYQIDALTILIYNIGAANWHQSTLARLVNEYKLEDAAKEFPRWIYVMHKPCDGLVKRREMEQRLFLKGLYE